ncbi:SDR family NAD(P)-dependent oxidoreductase [Jannaschia sp. M317]|uniref:SDR family NAD(P)-dependent oxidoreductase n=1 Tax=Jannaschia sp. M317 TaxID=2867011 RepID=UPI0021A49EEC|nr:SDR family NAD(P)-dependent oxidoreductase [Jannaschia sp. M317]UWQ16452.1 SDR family NAD(P)-dependent oxidoreductase [Jannaschia sp. M317]
MRALITGAGRGIGAALMAEGRGRGHEVLGTVRSGDGIQLEVTDPAAQARAAGAVGAIDLLVCNAGVLLDRDAGVRDLSVEDLRQTLDVNVTGVFLTVQAQLANLSRGGRIAIISSQMGSSTQATGRTMAYRVSKAAALNLGLNLASALRSEGIAVGIYHPGWVRTDMGGSAAAVGAEDAARGLWDRFERLDQSTSGCFETFDGQTHPI